MCLGFPQFPQFPLELQRSVFLTFKDGPNVHRYAHVAKRMHVWLEPYVYHVVHLNSNNKARAFLAVVTGNSRALHVIKLAFAKSVSISSMVEILTLCQNVEELAIRSSLRYLACRLRNPLLGPLSNLLRIKTMYTELATVAGEESVILPEFVWFNRLSQLHLGLSWASLDSVPHSFSSLPNLTHLSMFWTTSRSCTPELVQFLEKESTIVLILWIENCLMESTVHRDLRSRGLQDARVVIFKSGMMGAYMASGGFWMYAKRIVQWRVDNKGMRYSR